MKKKENSMQFRVFMYSLCMVLILYISFICWQMISYYNTSRDGELEALRVDVKRYSNDMDQEFEILNNTLIEVLYISEIKEYLDDAEQLQNNITEKTQRQYEIVNYLVSAVSPTNEVYQVTVYDFIGSSISSREKFVRNYDIRNIEWMENVSEKNGTAYLTIPYWNLDPIYSTDLKIDEWMISFSRVCKNKYGEQIGVIEVKQYADSFFETLLEIEENDLYQQVYVLDETGELVFPYNTEEEYDTENYVEALSALEYETSYVEESIGGLVGYYKSGTTGYTVVLTKLTNTYMETFNTYARGTILISMLGVMLLALFFYYGSKKIVLPLVQLRERIENYELFIGKSEKNKKIKSNIAEIDSLSYAFEDLNEKLSTSVRNLVLAEKQKLQYELLAFQSQMNPHFLYNSLASIYALAEEERTEEIMEMSQMLSTNLRYVASSGEDTVKIEQEIKFTKNFIELLKIRFGEKLQCEFDLDEELLSMMAPKLCIQPLVENSEKILSNMLPPWKIKVSGEVNDERWYVKVKDNGPGFDEVKLKYLMRRIEKMDTRNEIPKLKLDGMGLVNIYLRLKLLYGERLIFEINNPPEGGCEIIIGAEII